MEFIWFIPRDLRLTGAALMTVSVGGVVGFRLIEGWDWLDSLWMVVITLTTIGYGEVHPLSDPGRVFALWLIAAGVGLVGYAVARTTEWVVSGDFVEALDEQRRERAMGELRDHHIVVGFGRLGREVAADLLHHGTPVVVIDTDAGVVRAAAEIGALGIHGDGGSDAVLLAAGVARARGIAIATPSSPINVYVTLVARQANPKIAIVTRIDDPDAADKARRAGADRIVSPFRSGGSRMAQGLLHPDAAQFLEAIVARDVGGLAAGDVTISEGSALVGPLGSLEIHKRFGVLIVSVRGPDGQVITVPGADVALAAGSVIVAVGRPDGLAGLKRAALP